MKLNKKETAACAVFGFVGMALIIASAGWLAAIGVFMAMWANNISKT